MTTIPSVRIAVLLPTYNGERFLSRQLDSLLAQTLQDFVILVRDDGSGDSTKTLLQSYLQRNGGRIHLIEDDLGNLGASGNVSRILQYVIERQESLGLKDSYLMLCDQDDIWEPSKMEIEMRVMQELEARYPGSPLLVHSDLAVVREDESMIAESFVAFQGLDASSNALRHITFSNTVTGCTALCNQQLVRKALPIPPTAMMHDWWLALVAAAFGRIEFVPQALVRYRQHGDNTLGASEFIPRKVISRATLRQLLRRNPDDLLKAVASQAQTFANRFGSELTVRERYRLRLAGLLRTDSFLAQRLLFRLLKL